MTRICAHSPWCDEDCCRCMQWESQEVNQKVAGKRYKIYCDKCDGIVAYTNRKLHAGDVMESKLFLLNTGEYAKVGYMIRCQCKGCILINLKQGINELFDEEYMTEQDKTDFQNGII